MFKINFDSKKTILENGLEVLTIKNSSQIASVNIGVRVGAMYEDDNERGLSHFIEHMLFKGTVNRNNEEINDELEFLGGEYNAYTDYDATVYTISCLADEIENAIKLLSDMISKSTFPESELEKERGVIISEIKSGKDDIEDLTFKRVNEVGFSKSPLKYDVTGTEKNVSRYKREDLERYYKRYYIPNNSVVTVVSHLEHEHIIKVIKECLGEWKSGDNIEEISIKEDNIEVMKTSYKRDIEQSTIIYLYTFYDLDKQYELPLRILNNRLGESSNSLLFREIREKRGLAYDIYTHLESTSLVKTLYIYTAVAKEDIEETKKAIDETVRSIVDNKIIFNDRDLEIMKKVHKTAVINTLEDSAELCNYVMHQELDREDIYEFAHDMEELNNIDVNTLNIVAKKVLKNPTIHILTCN